MSWTNDGVILNCNWWIVITKDTYPHSSRLPAYRPHPSIGYLHCTLTVHLTPLSDCRGVLYHLPTILSNDSFGRFFRLIWISCNQSWLKPIFHENPIKLLIYCIYGEIIKYLVVFYNNPFLAWFLLYLVLPITEKRFKTILKCWMALKRTDDEVR